MTTSTRPTARPCSSAGRALLLLLAVLLLVLTGCATGPARPSTEEERVDRATELATRQPSDQALARYEQMLQRIRDDLDAELGPLAWHPFREQQAGACGGDFPIPGGLVVRLQTWGFDAPIPDADWPTATRIVTAVAAEFGFTAPAATVDKAAQGDRQPALHRLTGIDPDLGADYQLITNVTTVISVTTGCHPTANAT